MVLKYLNWSTIKSNQKNFVLVLIVFFVFIFLRTWLLPQTISFGWDQERDAQVVEKIISHTGFPLIGPRVVGDNGFYLGPYFFYLLAPFYFFTSLHPIAIMYFMSFFSIIFFVLSLYVINKIYNFRTALLFLLIWAVLPATVNADRIAWNPFLIPLVFSIIIFILDKLQPKPSSFIILGLILGLSYHIHFQNLFYIVLSFIFLIKKYSKSYPYLIWTIFGFALTFIPLIIFDIRHQWINFHLFMNFIFTSSSSTHSFFSFLPVWANFVGQLLGIKNMLFSIIFWLALIIYGIVNRRQSFFVAFTVVLLTTPLAFAVYGQRPSEYYFNYLLPIIILYFSILVSQLKIPTYIVALTLIIISFNTFNSLKINPTALFFKDEIIKKAKIVLNNSPVFITYEAPLGENNGFDYLIKYYKINRSTDSNRPNVQFIIPKRGTLPSSGNISLFVPVQI